MQFLPHKHFQEYEEIKSSNLNVLESFYKKAGLRSPAIDCNMITFDASMRLNMEMGPKHGDDLYHYPSGEIFEAKSIDLNQDKVSRGFTLTFAPTPKVLERLDSTNFVFIEYKVLTIENMRICGPGIFSDYIAHWKYLISIGKGTGGCRIARNEVKQRTTLIYTKEDGVVNSEYWANSGSIKEWLSGSKGRLERKDDVLDACLKFKI